MSVDLEYKKEFKAKFKQIYKKYSDEQLQDEVEELKEQIPTFRGLAEEHRKELNNHKSFMKGVFLGISSSIFASSALILWSAELNAVRVIAIVSFLVLSYALYLENKALEEKRKFKEQRTNQAQDSYDALTIAILEQFERKHKKK